MKPSIAAALILAVAAVVGTTLWYRSGDGEALLHQRVVADSAMRGGSSRGTLPPDVVLAIKPSAVPASLAMGRRTESAAMREFHHATRYGPLYERIAATAQPTAEELWIKAQIVRQCVRTVEAKKQNPGYPRWSRKGPEARAQFEASLPPKDPDRDRRLAAFDAIANDPCEGFPELEVSNKDIGAMIEAAAAAGDAKARVALIERKFYDSFKGPDGKPRTDIAVPPAPEGAEPALRELVASDDPIAASAAFSALAMPFSNLSLRTGDAQLPLDISAWHSAAQLLGCELGADCDADHQLQRACAMEGRCNVANLRDYQFFYGLTPASSQLVEQYLQGMRQARAGDWSYFTFHPGPAPRYAGYRAK